MDIEKLVKCYVCKFLGRPGLHHTCQEWGIYLFVIHPDQVDDMRGAGIGTGKEEGESHQDQDSWHVGVISWTIWENCSWMML